MAIATTNPATGKTVRSFEAHTEKQIEEKLARAEQGAKRQRELPPAERAKRLVRAADILKAKRDELGKLLTLEIGKLRAAGLAEVDKCALACRYYAENGPRFVADEEAKTDAVRSLVRYQPLGVVLAVMPWNFPLWQVFRFAAPALAAGNAGILKHAPNVSRCALEIEQLLREAGFPEGLFRAVFLSNEATAGVIADPRVGAVTLTGSDRAGSQVAERAGRHLKKTVLELGGSDPFIVLDDADLTAAAKTAADARLQNSGQSCIAVKRLIVADRVAGQFTERLISEMGSRRVGDPLDPATAVGPQARLVLRINLHRQVEEAVRRGAHLVLGGRLLAGPGAALP